MQSGNVTFNTSTFSESQMKRRLRHFAASTARKRSTTVCLNCPVSKSARGEFSDIQVFNMFGPFERRNIPGFSQGFAEYFGYAFFRFFSLSCKAKSLSCRFRRAV